MKELQDFIDISKFAGERFDLVQAGGGNSSVKLDNDTMYIKASGFALSDVDKNNAYTLVKTSKISNILFLDEVLKENDKRKREAISSKFVKEANLSDKKASIEVLLHSILYKYTLHTHPMQVNMITILKNWKDILGEIFSKEEIAFVDYQTPGIDLALSLKKSLENFNNAPKIIFLQNHGLIISSDDKQEISILTNFVTKNIERYLNLNFSKFYLTNEISKLFTSLGNDENISYLVCGEFLNKAVKENKALFFSYPFCPDSLVYCGFKACEISSLEDTRVLKEYESKFFELPKILIYNERIFIRAKNIKKAKEIEDVLKFSILVLNQNKNLEKSFLNMKELAYLNNWEAEKFRRKLK